MADTTIVPAAPGYFVIYAQDADLFLGEPIIAWCVVSSFSGDTHFPEVHPITPDGKPGENYVGYQYPDGRVSVLDGLHDSLDDAQQERSRQYAAIRPKTA